MREIATSLWRVGGYARYEARGRGDVDVVQLGRGVTKKDDAGD